MNHPAELALHKYMDDAANNKSTISEEVIQQIGNDIIDALRRQFGEKEPKKFMVDQYFLDFFGTNLTCAVDSIFKVF